MGKKVKMRIILIVFLLLTLSFNSAWAGANFTGLSSTLSIYDVSTLSSSPIDKKEQERRQALIKKIAEIQRQFEEAERLAYIGLSKEEIEEMYRKAVEVLNGAMVVCSSEIIN